jgi:hypothetical protein
VPEVEDALEEAQLLAEGEAVVLATGSIFVAAAVAKPGMQRRLKTITIIGEKDREITIGIFATMKRIRRSLTPPHRRAYGVQMPLPMMMG